jgi:hypothetical protein
MTKIILNRIQTEKVNASPRKGKRRFKKGWKGLSWERIMEEALLFDTLKSCIYFQF